MRSLPAPVALPLLWKTALAMLLLWFVAQRLFLANDIGAQWALFNASFASRNLPWLLPVLLLLPVNWWLETLKWHHLLGGDVAMREAWRSVMAGVALGFVSPGRIGEFAGRVWHLPEGTRTRAFYLSTIGGLAQTAVTFAAGTFCLALWTDNGFLARLMAGVSAVFMLLYFRFDLLNALLQKISILSRNNFILHASHLPPQGLMWRVAGLSLLRYAVYVVQYVAAFRFAGIEASLAMLSVHSGVLLLAYSLSPVLPALDFSYRGSVVLLVFGALSPNNLALLLATTLIWLFNLALPALAGYFFIIRKEKTA